MTEPEVDALVTDRYLDALMAAGDRRALDAPSDLLDPTLRRTALRLSADLVRMHPSFRFEERLAVQLAAAAEAMRGETAPATPIDLPIVLRSPVEAPSPGAMFGSPIVGSAFASAAITSAALSIGAAVVAIAWRRGHLAWRAGHAPRRPARQEARA